MLVSSANTFVYLSVVGGNHSCFEQCSVLQVDEFKWYMGSYAILFLGPFCLICSVYQVCISGQKYSFCFSLVCYTACQVLVLEFGIKVMHVLFPYSALLLDYFCPISVWLL